MMFLIYFIDKETGEHRFITKDLEYVKLAFESFIQDENITYVSFEYLEVKE